MRALVVGYGSIGARHARLLGELGCETAVVSKREVECPSLFADLEAALSSFCPEYLVIANPTASHFETLHRLAQSAYRGRVLVEKPLFVAQRAIPDNDFRSLSVAYNLRFHPVLQRVRELLVGQQLISVNAYVGQYLPDWRPGTDYRQSYSASAALGGGVLRDLSHELDYLGWLFGRWLRVVALGGQLSPLQIDSEDVYALLMHSERCPVVTVQLSYLDRAVRRRMVINTAEHTIEADLVAGTVTLDRDPVSLAVDRDHSYREMHRAALAGSLETLCSAEEALETLRLIEACERSNQSAEWIYR